MAALSWDLAQPVSAAPIYSFGRSHVIVWQSVGSGGGSFGDLTGTATSTSQATGTLSGLGALTGSAASTSSMTGTISDANYVPADIIPNSNLRGLWDINANLSGRKPS